jgi:hypothetical protein
MLADVAREIGLLLMVLVLPLAWVPSTHKVDYTEHDDNS